MTGVQTCALPIYQFYHDYSILNADTAEQKSARLVLAANVAKILKNGMALLGIEVPERM